MVQIAIWFLSIIGTNGINGGASQVDLPDIEGPCINTTDPECIVEKDNDLAQ